MTGGRGRLDGARLRDGQRRPGESVPDRQREHRLVPERQLLRAAGRELGLDRAARRTASRRDRLHLHGQLGRAALVQGALPGRRHLRRRRTAPASRCSVVDANIQITPNGVNRVGATHTFTAHVNVNDGTGFVNAPTARRSASRSTAARRRCNLHDRRRHRLVLGDLTSAITGVDDGDGLDDGLGRRRLADTHDERRRRRTPARRSSAGSTRGSRSPRTRPTRSAQPHTFTVTLQKDTGDGAGFVACRGSARRRHADRPRGGATPRSTRRRAPATTRCEHERGGPVHDHVHVEHGRHGHRPCDARPSRVDGLGAVHGRDRTAARRTRPTR